MFFVSESKIFGLFCIINVMFLWCFFILDDVYVVWFLYKYRVFLIGIVELLSYRIIILYLFKKVVLKYGRCIFFLR